MFINPNTGTEFHSPSLDNAAVVAAKLLEMELKAEALTLIDFSPEAELRECKEFLECCLRSREKPNR